MDGTCEDLLNKNGMKFENLEKILFMRRSDVLIEYFYSTYFYGTWVY